MIIIVATQKQESLIDVSLHCMINKMQCSMMLRVRNMVHALFFTTP